MHKCARDTMRRLGGNAIHAVLCLLTAELLTRQFFKGRLQVALRQRHRLRLIISMVPQTQDAEIGSHSPHLRLHYYGHNIKLWRSV